MLDVLLFLCGYCLILLVPGPNMSAIAALAAFNGRGAALSLIAGLSIGAALLLGLVLCLASLSQHSLLAGQAGPLASALALGYVAWSVSPRRAASASAIRRSGQGAASFVLGVCTAVSNPVTGAYFVSQAGHWSNAPWPADGFAAVAGVLLLCSGNGYLIATCFAGELARRQLLRHEAVLRAGVAAIFAGLAVWVAWPKVVLTSGELPELRLAAALMGVVAVWCRIGRKRVDANSELAAQSAHGPSTRPGRLSKGARRRARGKARAAARRATTMAA